MDEDLVRRYGRWHAAESSGAEGPAEDAFRAMLAGVPPVPVTADFTARTLLRVSEVAARDTRRAARTRWVMVTGGTAAGIVGAYYGAGYAVAAISAAFVALLDVFVNAIATTAGSMDRGADVWSVLGSLGRAAAAFMADPKVTVMMLAIQGIAAAALIALQRLLGAGRETFK